MFKYKPIIENWQKLFLKCYNFQRWKIFILLFKIKWTKSNFFNVKNFKHDLNDFFLYLLDIEKKYYFLISSSQKAVKTRPTPKKIQVNFKRSQTSRSWISIIPSSSIFVMLLIIKFDFSFSKGTKCVDEGWPEKKLKFFNWIFSQNYPSLEKLYPYYNDDAL